MRHPRRVSIIVFLTLTLWAVAACAATLSAKPRSVKFGTRQVGSYTVKGATITNTGRTTVHLIVRAVSIPDDFSFGIIEPSPCPALEPAPLAPGESCLANVGFRPSAFFAGRVQNAMLEATASDPATGDVIETLTITFSGKGK